MDDGQPSAGERLTSWKEIASFFRKGVRTVQRWERDEGLPVHRHRHQRRSSVYAKPEELAAWWAGHAGLVEDTRDDAGPEPLETLTVTPPEVLAPASGGSGAHRFLKWAIGPLVLGAGTGAAAFLLAARAPSAPPFPLVEIAAFERAEALMFAFADLNGDGRDDVVAYPGPAPKMHIYFGGAARRTSPDVTITHEDALTTARDISDRGHVVGDYIDGAGRLQEFVAK